PRRSPPSSTQSGPSQWRVTRQGRLGRRGPAWARRPDVPVVTRFPSRSPKYARHYGVPVLEPLIWRWLMWFHGPARLTHTPGEFIRDELVARGLRWATVWGRGVDPRRFHPGNRDPYWRARLRANDDQVLILHVGRLAPEKNLDVLIDCWKLGRAIFGSRAVWAIAGRGPLAQRLAAEPPWVRRAGIRRPAAR